MTVDKNFCWGMFPIFCVWNDDNNKLGLFSVLYIWPNLYSSMLELKMQISIPWAFNLVVTSSLSMQVHSLEHIQSVELTSQLLARCVLLLLFLVQLGASTIGSVVMGRCGCWLILLRLAFWLFSPVDWQLLHTWYIREWAFGMCC